MRWDQPARTMVQGISGRRHRARSTHSPRGSGNRTHNAVLIFKRSMMKYIVWSVLLLTPCLTYGQHVRSPLQEGQIHYELQEYDAASERFRLVRSDPNSPREVYRYLVSSYLLNQQPEEAAKFAQKGLDIYPDYLQLQVMKGEALIQTDTHKAILVFENVLHSFQEAGTHVTEGIRQTDIKEYLIRLYQKGAAEASQGGGWKRLWPIIERHCLWSRPNPPCTPAGSTHFSKWRDGKRQKRLH